MAPSTRSSRVLRSLEFLDGTFSSILVFAGSVSCGASMLLITADVVSRYLLNAPIPGTLEVTEFLLCMMVFGALAHLEIRGQHVRMMLVYSRLPARTQYALSAFARGLGALFFGLMTWQTSLGTLHSFAIQEATWGEVAVPVWIGKAFISVGCLALTLHLLGSFVLDLGGRERRA